MQNNIKNRFSMSYYQSDPDRTPSVESDVMNVNNSIKKNTEEANVEVEKGEVVLDPSLTALFQVQGKRHHKGGTPVFLKPKSFIFSDHSSLSLDEKDHELFEFKKGGNFNKNNNTPAKVLKRNVDTKHYNRLIENIKNPFEDDIAKKSSSMMLEKYLETIGQIAFVQEGKKDFPEGVPTFAQGTAPVYNPELKKSLDMNKQYMKYGGKVLPKAQNGEASFSTNPGFSGEGIDAVRNILKNPRFDDFIKGVSLFSNDELRTYLEENPIMQIIAPSLPFIKNNKTIEFFKGFPEERINKMMEVGEYINSKIPILNTPKKVSGVQGADNEDYDKFIGPPDPPAWYFNKVQTEEKKSQDKIKNTKSQQIFDDPEFSDMQKKSQMYNLLKAVSVKKYNPYRSHYNPRYVNSNLINPEQTINDMRAMTNQQMMSDNYLSPILQNAQKSDIAGKLLDQISQVRSQYDNQNAQILNKTDVLNTQIANLANLQNNQYDQNYYKETITGKQNFDNMKQYLIDEYLNNVVKNKQDIEKLDWALKLMNNPAYKYNWKKSKLELTGKDPLSVNLTEGEYDPVSTFFTDLFKSGEWKNITAPQAAFLQSFSKIYNKKNNNKN